MSELNPDQYINTRKAAELLGLSPTYLRQLRQKGGGPPYSTFGRAVRYQVSEVLAWASSKAATRPPT